MRFLSVVLAIMVLSGFLLFGQSQLKKCVHDPKQASFNQWHATLQAHGYAASTRRRQEILNRFKDLQLGMTRAKVEALMGKPDYEMVGRYATPFPRCDYGWGYMLAVSDPNYLSAADQGVFVFFTDADKAYWIYPQAIVGLQEKGKRQE